jgi:citrate lyase subunit beta/citryl-CoA lyase
MLPEIPPTVALFVPGDRPDRFGKAAVSGADAVILDLEDAVTPDRKASARAKVAAHGMVTMPIVVRVNARRSAWFPDDLAALEWTPFAAIMLPKAESGEDIAVLHQGLGRCVPVIPLVETAAGMANLSSILRAPAVLRLAFGALDLALDLGCEEEAPPIALSRSQLVMQSRAAGRLPPLDGVTTAISDAARIEADARMAAALGLGGKLAIHPDQIGPIRRGFAADPERVTWAREVLAQAGKSGAADLKGVMVDAPILARARRILRRAGHDA